jgi:hypothetical protein
MLGLKVTDTKKMVKKFSVIFQISQPLSAQFFLIIHKKQQLFIIRASI